MDKRLVKVTTITYVPAYTPEDYQSWKDMRGDAVFAHETPPEIDVPETIEACVELEQKLLNDPSSDLDLALYTETEVVNHRVTLELMQEGFNPPAEFQPKDGLYLRTAA